MADDNAMTVIAACGKEELATVFIAEMSGGRIVEFVESTQPPIPREDKWVLIVSTLFGCPVGCQMCDAGGDYRGKLSREQMLSQIDFMVSRRYPDRYIPVPKFKVQFARLGEPALNDNVLAALGELPRRYRAPGLMPCISTIAPRGRDRFFEELRLIKKKHYRGRFQLQFSIHSTDEAWRDMLMPAPKWTLEQIARYGETFIEPGDRKIALGFALARNVPVDPDRISRYFDPERHVIKVTPVNPTYQAVANGLVSAIKADGTSESHQLLVQLRRSGFEVIVSIGELEENRIGTNCGQYVTRYLQVGRSSIAGGYRSLDYGLMDTPASDLRTR